MGRSRTFDLEEALVAATRLFWRGYDSTSLTDLTGPLGIGPASFYFAFESKDALFRQVVDRYIASQSEAFERAFQAPTTGAGVKALLRGYVDVKPTLSMPRAALSSTTRLLPTPATLYGNGLQGIVRRCGSDWRIDFPWTLRAASCPKISILRRWPALS